MTSELSITIKPRDADLAYVNSMLSGIKGGAPRAIESAINDELRHARTAISSALREHLTLSKARTDKSIHIERASRATLRGLIWLDWRGIALVQYAHKALTRKYRNFAPGVWVNVRTDRGWETIPKAFKAGLPYGREGKSRMAILRRFGEKVVPKRGRYAGRIVTRGPRKGEPLMRQPLRELGGPSVLAAWQNAPGLADKELKDIDARLSKRLASKVEWLLFGRSTELPT